MRPAGEGSGLGPAQGPAPDPPLPRTRPGRDTPPTWATRPEALGVCLYRPNRRRIALIAAVVGTLLVGINQGSVLANEQLGWVVWLRIILDYLIPAFVSTMGVLAGTRRASRDVPDQGS